MGSKTTGHREEKNILSNFRKTNVGTTGQSISLNFRQSYGVSPLAKHFSGHMEKVMTENNHHRFAKGKSFLTNPIAFYNKMISFNDEGRAEAVIYLKAFNTVSLQVRMLWSVSSDGQSNR